MTGIITPMCFAMNFANVTKVDTVILPSRVVNLGLSSGMVNETRTAFDSLTIREKPRLVSGFFLVCFWVGQPTVLIRSLFARRRFSF